MTTISLTGNTINPKREEIQSNSTFSTVLTNEPLTIDMSEKLSLTEGSENGETSISDTMTKFQKIKNKIIEGQEFAKDKVVPKAIFALDLVYGGIFSIINNVVFSSVDIFDRAESFIDKLKGKENSPGSVDDIRDSQTIKSLEEYPDYVKILDARHASADPDVKAIYDKYEKHIKISNIYAYKSSSYYSHSKDITVCASEDSEERPKAGGRYFHEVGHLIDDKMAIGTAFASNKKSFTTALKTDFDNYVNNYMKKNNIADRVAAYVAIGNMMSGKDCDDYKNVSDIFGGLSGNMAKGQWGHSNEYWKGHRHSVNNEAFASMFEVSMNGNEKALKNVKEMLPLSYEAFLTMLKNDI